MGVAMKIWRIRIAIFMLGVTFVFPSWAGLELVGRNGRTGEAVFIDSKYVREVGSHVEARFFVSFNEPRHLRTLNKSYRSMISYVVADCSTKKSGLSGIEIFEDNNWQKKIRGETGHKPEMESVRPGTVNEAMWSATCYLSQKR